MPKLTWALRAKKSFTCRLVGAGIFTLALTAAAQAQVTIGRNVNGTNLGNVSLIPPDTMGAIGVDHFVQFVNGRFAVYNKATGGLVGLSTVADSTFWNNAGATWQTALSDPRIVYDHASGRWFASELDIPGGAGTPTGTPTSFSGRYPLYWDHTNKKMYVYDGSWLGGTAPGVWS